MKLTTRRSVAAAALLFLSTAVLAMAQGPGGGPPDPERMATRQLDGMKERLKLTDDQVAKLKPILLDSAKQNAEMRKKMTPGEPPSEEMRAQMAKSREAVNAKVLEVLTDDQKTEYKKMMEERKGMMGGPGGQRKKQQ